MEEELPSLDDKNVASSLWACLSQVSYRNKSISGLSLCLPLTSLCAETKNSEPQGVRTPGE